MQESKVTAKGQTTLPRDVRAALNIEAGDTVRYLVDCGEVRIVKARGVAEVKGLLHRPGQRAVSLDEMEDAIQAGATE